MRVSLASIRKNGRNKGVVVVSVEPAILIVSKVDFLSTSSFFVKGQFITLDSSSYESGNITLAFSYKFTL